MNNVQEQISLVKIPKGEVVVDYSDTTLGSKLAQGGIILLGHRGEEGRTETHLQLH